MKFQVTMKTPYGLDYALDDSCGSDDEYDEEKIAARKVAERWFQYGECVTLEIDTEKETCIVLEN